MKKGTKWLLIGTSIAGTIVATASAVRRGVAKKLVGVALEREDENKKESPKTTSRVSGGDSVKDNELSERIKQATEKLLEQELETVEMTSYEGLKMTGHFYPCEDAKRTIIAMHGWRSSWTSDFAIISEFWHNNGCNILFAEQRGQGSSEGEYMSFGLVERYDCAEWAKWANEHIDNTLPIYLCGLSMGAATVLMASSLEMPENVNGIIADCGFTSLHAIWKHVVENNLRLSYGIIGDVTNDICKKKIKMGTQDFSTVDALKETKLPVLFIHGTDDRFVPIEMTYENYKACVSPKKLLVVPGAGHSKSYLADTELYEQTTLEFWGEFDKIV